ncbi:MAG: 16S rRNA (adenine(1518)-N(6)/adenine(1519)-N(6))-dimethyltransferase RsmA [Pseudomonadota bacterium]|nr:16S rRNA (adenine(1518)-N(6)/adenine(1519)-N(6))-dimethyltransferase RsmA [Pseudomonadota bacterium]
MAVIPNLSTLPPLRDVIALHDLSARKSLGQNFLLDLNITRRIVQAAGPLEDRPTIEIGPGPGGLTRALLEAGARPVIAVERDPRCIDALAGLKRVAGGSLHLVQQNAIEFDPAPFATEFGPLTIVANLPYNIATSLLILWLKKIELFGRMVLMFQSEVAERLVASPGTKAYGRLSVATQWRCDVRPVLTLPARAFTPAPKVDSTVVTITPRAEPLAKADGAALETVVAAAFSQRRKMLRSSLKGLFNNANITLTDAGIDPTARAETIDIEGFCSLARAYKRETKLTFTATREDV